MRAKTLRASVLISRRSPPCNRGDRRKATFRHQNRCQIHFANSYLSIISPAIAVVLIITYSIACLVSSLTCFTGNTLYKWPIVSDMTSRGTIGNVDGKENSFSYSSRNFNRSSELVTTAMLSSKAGHTSYSHSSTTQNSFCNLS